MDIIAHRGASFDAPENTLAALRLGFEQGADAGEVDVHLTRDRRVVVIHDATTKRTAGVNLAIRHSALSRLKTLDVGSWKGRQWASQRIPLLEEVLEILPKSRRLFVEIKCGPEILPHLAPLLRTTAPRVALIAFDLDTLSRARLLLPDTPIYWLSAFRRSPLFQNRKPTPSQLLQISLASHFNGLNLLHTGPLDASFIHLAHARRQQIYAWTVDKPAAARRLQSLGLDGLATNRPAWLRQRLANKLIP